MTPNETILKNVHLAFERFVKDQAKKGVDENRTTVAERMNEHALDVLGRKLGDPVGTFRALMNGRQKWSPAYLALFAIATESPLQELDSPTYAGQAAPQEDFPVYFKQWIRRELTVEQMRALVTMMRRDLRRPGAFELAAQIHEALVAAPDLRSARDAVDEILRRSLLWEPGSDRKKVPK